MSKRGSDSSGKSGKQPWYRISQVKQGSGDTSTSTSINNDNNICHVYLKPSYSFGVFCKANSCALSLIIGSFEAECRSHAPSPRWRSLLGPVQKISYQPCRGYWSSFCYQCTL